MSGAVESPQLTQFLTVPTPANLLALLSAFKDDGKTVIDAIFPKVCGKAVSAGVLLHFTDLLIQEGKLLEAGHFARLLEAAQPDDPFVCRLTAAVAAKKGDFSMARAAHSRAEALKSPDEVLMVTGTLMLLVGGHRDLACRYASGMLDRVKAEWLCFDVAIEAAIQGGNAELLQKAVLREGREPRLGQQQRMQAQLILMRRLIEVLKLKK